MAVCQNLVPLVNIKIAGKWMFIPLKMVLIGIDPYPYLLLALFQSDSSNQVKVCESGECSHVNCGFLSIHRNCKLAYTSYISSRSEPLEPHLAPVFIKKQWSIWALQVVVGKLCHAIISHFFGHSYHQRTDFGEIYRTLFYLFVGLNQEDSG
jgi:hypothetical protein